MLATGRKVPSCLRIISGITLFGVEAPFAVLPLAQQHITSSTAGIADAMTPAATVVISHMWPGGERATVGKLWGVAFGVAGLAFLAIRGAEPARTSVGQMR